MFFWIESVAHYVPHQSSVFTLPQELGMEFGESIPLSKDGGPRGKKIDQQLQDVLHKFQMLFTASLSFSEVCHRHGANWLWLALRTTQTMLHGANSWTLVTTVTSAFLSLITPYHTR